MPSLNPMDVPAFPVYTVTLSDADHAVTLDGSPVAVDPGCAREVIAKNAVQARLNVHGLEAVRVSLIDLDTGDRWNMIVSADGEVIDLTEQEQAAAAAVVRRKKRGRLIIGAVITALVLAAGGGITAALWPKPKPPAEAYEPKGVGATLPVAPPPQFSKTATWSQPVAPDSATAMLPNGMLLTATTSGYLEGLNPKTGEPVWRGSSPPSDLTDLHFSHWSGADVLVYASNNDLKVWPLDMPEGKSSVSPRTMAFPGDRQTTTAKTTIGTEPFVNLGDWYVAIPGTGKLDTVELPPGTTPINVDAKGNITALSHNQIYTVASNGKVQSHRKYTAPEGTKRAPTNVKVLDSSHIFATWEADSSTQGILDLKTGKVSTGTETRALQASDTPIVDDDAKTAILGKLALDFGPTPSVHTLPDRFTPASLHGGTVYGTTNEGPATVNIEGDTKRQAEAKPWNSYSDDDAAPNVVTDDAAYVVGTQLGKSTIYRTDRKGA